MKSKILLNIVLFLIFSTSLSAKPTQFNPDSVSPYFKKIMREADNLKRFDLGLTCAADDARAKKLTPKEALNELFMVQNLYRYHRNSYISARGARIYSRTSYVKLLFLGRAHAKRINRAFRNVRYDSYGWEVALSGENPESDRIQNFRNQPDEEVIRKSIMDLQYPDEMFAGLRIYASPYESDTNGRYFSDGTLYFMAHAKWKVGPTTVAHELGHAAHFRLFHYVTGADKKYWKIRETPPVPNMKAYGDFMEVVAEDFRVLYGGTEKATIKRKWSKYGDIRNYPKRHIKLKKFIDKYIEKKRGLDQTIFSCDGAGALVYYRDEIELMRIEVPSRPYITEYQIIVYYDSEIDYDNTNQPRIVDGKKILLPKGEHKINLADWISSMKTLKTGRYLTSFYPYKRISGSKIGCDIIVIDRNQKF
ncbi:MAG: hypothetical protein OEZ34_13755 [Spirochaetia bacterium]|nr:hypothetical protein [Spirochaetia bacterium]